MTDKEYEVTYLQPMIDKDHRDPLWYGGRLVEVKYKGYTFILGAYGDVRATLLLEGGGDIYVKDKYNAGRFYDEMHNFIKSDFELADFENKGKLTIDNNNWFEILIDGPDGKQHDLGWLCDSFDYEDAVDELLAGMDEVISDIEGAA